MTWHCDKCTTRYSVGAPACPHCGETRHHDDHDCTCGKPATKPAKAEKATPSP